MLLCRIPTEFSEGARRKFMRYNTSRFNNLHLFFPEPPRRYRIVDLSTNGCKVFVNEDAEKRFPLGQALQPVQIAIAKYLTDLHGVVPRVHKGKTVGCEFTYGRDSDANRYINHLISSLKKTEEDKLVSTAL